MCMKLPTEFLFIIFCVVITMISFFYFIWFTNFGIFTRNQVGSGNQFIQVEKLQQARNDGGFFPLVCGI